MAYLKCPKCDEPTETVLFDLYLQLGKLIFKKQVEKSVCCLAEIKNNEGENDYEAA